MKKGEYQPQELEADYKLLKAYADFLKDKEWLDLALVELFGTNPRYYNGPKSRNGLKKSKVWQII